jgi:hypothetical protein
MGGPWINLRNGVMLGVALAAPMLLSQAPVAPSLQNAKAESVPAKAEQLFALANQARAAQGLGTLKWDQALAAAALQHCLRMAAEGPIAHRYGGEPDLTARASQAGAHFSLIEENIAVGSNPASIHQGWMDSPDHRANLLSPDVDHVGIAVVAANGVLLAVADYTRAVVVLTPVQVEAAFAGMLRAKGLSIVKDPAQARAYCASSGRFNGPDPPSFLMRWQNPDVTQLPSSLVEKVASGEFRQAAVGSCPAQDLDGGFTVYRVAVLLYGADSAPRPKQFFQP